MPVSEKQGAFCLEWFHLWNNKGLFGVKYKKPILTTRQKNFTIRYHSNVKYTYIQKERKAEWMNN